MLRLRRSAPLAERVSTVSCLRCLNEELNIAVFRDTAIQIEYTMCCTYMGNDTALRN